MVTVKSKRGNRYSPRPTNLNTNISSKRKAKSERVESLITRNEVVSIHDIGRRFVDVCFIHCFLYTRGRKCIDKCAIVPLSTLRGSKRHSIFKESIYRLTELFTFFFVGARSSLHVPNVVENSSTDLSDWEKGFSFPLSIYALFCHQGDEQRMAQGGVNHELGRQDDLRDIRQTIHRCSTCLRLHS